jgi:hypothetical protein
MSTIDVLGWPNAVLLSDSVSFENVDLTVREQTACPELFEKLGRCFVIFSISHVRCKTEKRKFGLQAVKGYLVSGGDRSG